MAAYLEPKNGNFQALAEQLVSQSQTTTELKQNALRQADLETSKEQIRSSHRAAIQELKQENQPYNRMRSQSLSSTQRSSGMSSTAPTFNSAASSSHQTKSVKRKTNEPAQSRTQTAAQRAHSLHQRSQTAAQTAHQLHTQPRPARKQQRINPSNQNLFDLTPNQAAKPDSATFMQLLQNNPQLLDNPLLMSGQDQIPEYLKPQVEQIVTKLNAGQKFVLFFGSIFLSLLLTIGLSNLLKSMFYIWLTNQDQFISFLIFYCIFILMGFNFFKRLNRNRLLHIFTPLGFSQYQANRTQGIIRANQAQQAESLGIKLSNTGNLPSGLGIPNSVMAGSTHPQGQSSATVFSGSSSSSSTSQDTNRKGLAFWSKASAWALLSIVCTAVSVKFTANMLDNLLGLYHHYNSFSGDMILGFSFFVLFGSIFSLIFFGINKKTPIEHNETLNTQQPKTAGSRISGQNQAQNSKRQQLKTVFTTIATNQQPKTIPQGNRNYQERLNSRRSKNQNQSHSQRADNNDKTPAADLKWVWGSIFSSVVMTIILTNSLAEFVGSFYEDNFFKFTFCIFIFVFLWFSHVMRPKD